MEGHYTLGFSGAVDKGAVGGRRQTLFLGALGFAAERLTKGEGGAGMQGMATYNEAVRYTGFRSRPLRDPAEYYSSTCTAR